MSELCTTCWRRCIFLLTCSGCFNRKLCNRCARHRYWCTDCRERINQQEFGSNDEVDDEAPSKRSRKSSWSTTRSDSMHSSTTTTTCASDDSRLRKHPNRSNPKGSDKEITDVGDAASNVCSGKKT